MMKSLKNINKKTCKSKKKIVEKRMRMKFERKKPKDDEI